MLTVNVHFKMINVEPFYLLHYICRIKLVSETFPLICPVIPKMTLYGVSEERVILLRIYAVFPFSFFSKL